MNEPCREILPHPVAAERAPFNLLSALNFLSFENRQANPAAFVYFGIFIALQLAVLLTFIRFTFPYTWEQQMSAGFWNILLTCVGFNVVTCFGEYLFHRYLLHMEPVRFLRTLCSSHLAHHKLTFIGFDDQRKTVRSEYPIGDVEHDDQSTFPPWALLPFFAFFSPFFAALAFSFPQFPILIGGFTAVAIAHFLYETIHAAYHQPYETHWKPRIESPRFGRVWQLIYGFHQAHHANYKCNMNVAGFYGIPLADILMGTYKQPDAQLHHGAVATKEVARHLTPKPYGPIAWLDRVAFNRRRRVSKQW